MKASQLPDIFTSLNVKAEEQTRTGVYTLENGGNSLVARLWLFDHAQKSIAIQYYSFSKDVSGLIATDYAVRAADRGVKIRLLIDEAASRMYDHEIKVLDAHDNIEIRVYNAGLKLGRLDRKLRKLVKNANRLMRRMHNKALIVDGQVAVIGGRNMADEYFDFDKKYNFRDRDVLLLGKAVGEVENSFEQFWNDKLTVTFEELAGKFKKPFSVAELFKHLHRFAKDTPEIAPRIRERVKAFAGDIAKAQESGEWLWTEHVRYISDIPGKNEDKTPRLGGISTDTIISLIRYARVSLDIQSPYLITTDDDKRLLREAVERGVRVRILTNSMASTDNLAAFGAYQRDRKEDLATGVELYEYRPDAAVRFQLMVPEVQEKTGYAAVYGLHSKSMVIDGKIAVIGSYNLDPRSANYNTECIAVIRSPEAAKNLSKYIDEDFLSRNAWRISPEYNPDKEASLKRRIKTFTRKVVPKKLL